MQIPKAPYKLMRKRDTSLEKRLQVGSFQEKKKGIRLIHIVNDAQAH